MVHSFKILNDYFALDVESGSVFVIDKLTYFLLGGEEEKSSTLKKPDEIIDNAERFSEFTGAEIAEAKQEIQKLINDGVLFTNYPIVSKSKRDSAIKAMCLNICHDCNLRCKYCFAEEGIKEHSKMSFETAKNAVDFLIAHSKNRKNLEIDFFGGEPLLNLDVVKQTVVYAKEQAEKFKKSFKFTITTNGVLLTEENRRYLNESMYNVVLSIDGRESVHNSMRKNIGGSNSFEPVLKNSLEMAKLRTREGKDHYARGTYTSQNLDFHNDVIALHESGFEQISLEPVVLDETSELAIKDSHLPQIRESYLKLAEYYLKMRAQDETWFNFFHFMMDFDGASPCESKLTTGCGAGSEYIAVAPDGTIYPCHQFAGKLDYRMGNVNTGVFDDSVSQQMSQINLFSKKDCSECWAKYYCGGGCACNNLNFGGSLTGVYKTGCEIMRIRTEAAIAINAIEHQQQD